MANPEILAPAGSMETLIAALRCGADAVYIGAKAYSARSSAVNFDLPELRQAAELCHLYGAKLHLAVNTLLTDKELPEFQEFICKAAESGIDACIVQDLGVLKIIKSIIPEMTVHASTQMSIHTPEGALQAKSLGCSRIVAAREMSLEDLKLLCALPVETEAFVHGALCMSVSGQCSFSAVAGGRSANRGQCAQACRLPWKTPSGRNPAALSLKDLSLAEHVQELKKIGVDSFKIEGRMKRPEYVASAVTALKMALEGLQPDMETLQAVFSRSGFTDGYFTGIRKNMFGYRRKEDVLAGQKVFKEIQAGYEKERTVTSLDFSMKMKANQPVLLTVSDEDGNIVTVSGEIPETALKSPLTSEMLRKSMQKLGDTVYFCRNVVSENPDGLILSASQCNALRRNAVEAMNTERVRNNTPVYEIHPEIEFQLETKQHSAVRKRLHIRKLSQIQGISAEIVCLPVSLAQNCKPELSYYIEAPRIIRNEKKYAQKLKELYQKGYRHLICHNLADVRIGRNIGLILHGGFGLNCTNRITAQSLAEQGLQDVMLSYELSARSLNALAGCVSGGAFVYGRLPMMLFRVCPIKSQDGCHRRNCMMTDRTGRKFPLLCSQEYDYIEMLNSETLWIADKLQDFSALAYQDFYFTEESPEQIRQILHDYEYQSGNVPEKRTNGLYFKGGLR
ncbi:MAG: U32 family peptidase [Oscillospiraceae bacterium]|nr:U32 family peptidase [Oscillospiraceae bacterium]